MKRHETEAAIEAILFATGRAVPEEDIARALDMDRDEIGRNLPYIAQIKKQ